MMLWKKSVGESRIVDDHPSATSPAGFVIMTVSVCCA